MTIHENLLARRQLEEQISALVKIIEHMPVLGMLIEPVDVDLTVGVTNVHEDRAVGEALDEWLEAYRPTLSASYAELAEMDIRQHLGPSFGALRLEDLDEARILRWIGEKTAEPGDPEDPDA